MILEKRPAKNEYSSYYETYIGKVEGDNFFEKLKELESNTTKILSSLTEKQWNYKYAPKRWTVKEVMIHVMDTERIFAYRALRVGRNDKTPLPGFEQNDYVPFYQAEHRTPASIIAEYKAVRNASLQMFQNFSKEDWSRFGTASGQPVTSLALGFMIAGHEIHHVQILKEKYFLKE